MKPTPEQLARSDRDGCLRFPGPFGRVDLPWTDAVPASAPVTSATGDLEKAARP